MTLDEQLDALKRYYAGHADEYERIYYRDHVIRQQELSEISDTARRLFEGRSVLEVACGTGYWTQIVAGVAAGIVATDVSDEMLELARSKDLPAGRVVLQNADAFSLEDVDGNFDAGLACFWYSHVPKSRTDEFIHGFHDKLGKNAVVFMIDNMYARGFGGDLIRRPHELDTFKRRVLSDGSSHEILKNYYDAGELEAVFSPVGKDLVIRTGRFYWWMTYRVR